METVWYQYLFAFLAGGLFVNVLPHFFKGITGSRFPTPFAKPRRVGLSSPAVNIVWAMINGALSILFFYLAKIDSSHQGLWISAAVGGVSMSFFLASYFEKNLQQCRSFRATNTRTQ